MNYLGGAHNHLGGAKGKKRKEMYKKDECSPGKNDVEGSCLDDDIVIKVGKALNKLSHKNNKIDTINLDQIPENIHGDICLEISKISSCSSEACWQKIKSLMDLLGTDKEEFIESFKPEMPKDWINDYNKWLNTYDIENALNQHMDADEDFYFYGAVPIDFNKCSVSKDLCKFSLDDHLKKKQTKIGIVFNTDPSTKDGQHWISLYVDVGKHNNPFPGIYYFDSFGRNPPSEIKNLINDMKKQFSKLGMKTFYFYNDYPYQKQNSQCGMFSIHFLKCMLDNLSFQEYLNLPLSDNMMIDLRDKYFIKI